MTKNQLINFVGFYFEESINDSCGEENINFISQELEDAGIDADVSEQRTLELFEKAKAEARIERGRIFKQKYNELVNNISALLPRMEEEEPELATEFRKLKDSLGDGEFLDDNKKMKLLEYLLKKNL